nr:MAG TPA: hypothetical protein [Caudoviricetes sp.]DAL33950.1 MAG TPA_asm: hypothetical protein [Caudoviricetes sp.]
MRIFFKLIYSTFIDFLLNKYIFQYYYNKLHIKAKKL